MINNLSFSESVNWEEHVGEKRAIIPQSEIYSLGALLLTIVTLHEPYDDLMTRYNSVVTRYNSVENIQGVIREDFAEYLYWNIKVNIHIIFLNRILPLKVYFIEIPQ
jgi:hypothetical protein